MVSETTRLDASAIATVRANGRNSSPTSSPTSAIGRKTATVVIVEAVEVLGQPGAFEVLTFQPQEAV